jgi:hypothetical protein
MIHADHLQAYARIKTSEDGKDLVCKSIDGKKDLKRSAIKEGDITLIGHDFCKAEKGFSVFHLGIVVYQRSEEGKILRGKDGEPLLYMLHANSTGKYGQSAVVSVTGLRSYIDQRQKDDKKTSEEKNHYAQMLVCKIKEEK